MAMSVIQKVTKQRPCPICGKPDWCGFKLIDGGELVICMRDAGRADVIGQDGQCYTFVSAKTGNSIYELTAQREARLGNASGKAPTGSFTPKAYIYEERVVPFPNEKLDMIYRDLLDMLLLEKQHERYMLGERWDKRLMKNNLIKSFPEDSYYRYKNLDTYVSYNISREKIAAQLVHKYGELTGLPGAYKKPTGVWTFAGLGGITFPIYDVYGRIIRLRIRIDRRFTDGDYNDISAAKFKELDDQDLPCNDRGKYHNLSSYSVDREKYQQNIIANRFDCGCEAGNQIGYYFDEDRDDFFICYVTEGEKKSIMGNDVLHVPFLNIPGVNSYAKLLEKDAEGKRPVDHLKDLGVRIIAMAYDADKAINPAVLDCETGTIELLKKEGFQIAVAKWDIAQGKGVDDLLINGYRPVFEYVQ